ncbi:MAG: pentapeptide repeat-containing protein [Candidatus Zixiibacteriota bacterium]|jgi:hypothetical protein
MGEETNGNRKGERKTRERDATCAKPLCKRNAVWNSEYCILHAEIEKKDPDDFWEEFKEHFESGLREYDDSEKPNKVSLNCTNFVFPPQGRWRFPEEIPFNVDFSFSEFYGEVDFQERTFRGRASFIGAKFKKVPEGLERHVGAYRKYDRRRDRVHFRGSKFPEYTSFAATEFECMVNFQEGYFKSLVVFDGGRFLADTDFSGRHFEKEASFQNATFEREVLFVDSLFKNEAKFNGSVFEGNTYFSRCEFRLTGDFTGIESSSYFFLNEIVKEYERDGKGSFVYEDRYRKIITADAEIHLVHAQFYGKAKVTLARTLLKNGALLVLTR